LNRAYLRNYREETLHSNLQMLIASSTGDILQSFRATTLAVMPSTSREVTFLEADQLGMLFEALLDEAHHDKEVYAHTFPPSLAYWDIVSREYALRLVEELVMYKQAFHENKVQADQTKLLDVLVTLDTLIKLLEIEDLFRRKANGVHDVFVLPVRNWLDKASEGWLFLLRFSRCGQAHLVSQ